MASLNPENPSNPSVRVVSSSKLPLGNNKLTNVILDGYICNLVITGVAVSKGSVLVPSTSVDRQVILSPGSAVEDVIGVSAQAGLVGSEICMIIGGEFQVQVTGAVTRGDFLSTSATLGVAESTGTDGSEGDFAIATNSDAVTGTKLVWARFKKAEVY